MSYLARTFRPLTPAGRGLVLPSRSVAVAGFHTSSVCRALSEDNLHHEDRAKDIDHHKGDSVEKAKTGRGEWKPELASSSEQHVKADKHDMTLEEMQKLGSKRSEEDKNPGGSDSSKGAHDA